MKILVLGSEGQIGKPTCKYLESQGHEVIRFDKKTDIYQDLSEGWSVWDDLDECDFVYYFASNVGGAKYLEKYQHTFEFIEDNLRIMVNTFTALKETKKPFIFTSSQMAELPYSTYGQMKLLGEKMTKDLGGLAVRLWNVYGYEDEEEKAHVITDFCKMAKREGKIKMRTDGEESRQLLYAEDCAKALLTLTEKYDTLDRNKNYHITNFEWVKIKEVAEILSKHTGCEVEYGTNKDMTQMNAMNDPDPYILELWKPETKLEEGIIKIYDQC